jgi:hypothetical protein
LSAVSLPALTRTFPRACFVVIIRANHQPETVHGYKVERRGVNSRSAFVNDSWRSMRLLRNLAIKSRPEARGNVKGFFISNELDYVPCAVNDCDAMLALLKMSFHSSAKTHEADEFF